MKRKEKIIIVTRNMTAGGAERVIAQLANYFVQRGYKCEIITMDREKVMYDLDSRIKFREVGIQAKNKVVDRVGALCIVKKDDTRRTSQYCFNYARGYRDLCHSFLDRNQGTSLCI